MKKTHARNEGVFFPHRAHFNAQTELGKLGDHTKTKPHSLYERKMASLKEQSMQFSWVLSDSKCQEFRLIFFKNIREKIEKKK